MKRLAILVLMLAAPIAAQTPAEVGPKVGERVPLFSLQDQHGRTTTLQSVLGPNGAVIVFYRSADW